MIKVTSIIKWMCLLFGAIGMVGGGVLHYYSQMEAKKKVQQIPIAPRVFAIDNTDNTVDVSKNIS